MAADIRNRWPRAIAVQFAFATIGAILTPAMAGSFSVTPVRIYMTPRDRAVAVTIVNEGDTEVALQADLNTWTQKADGEDQLVLTEDMILSPPIMKVPPRGRQVVRLAMLKPPDASRQLTYRLIVREVPEATMPKDQVLQIPISLAMSMPVFITPPAAKRDMSCAIGRAADQALTAQCANIGSAYAQVREIVVKRDNQVVGRFEGGTYILPGARKLIPIEKTQGAAGGALHMSVTFDDGKSQDFDLSLP